MIVLGSIIILTYIFTMLILVYGYQKILDFTYEKKQAKTKFTILIPFRNEAKNLPVLLHSILEIKYPNTMFEVFFMDDESTDDSVKIIEKIVKNSTLSFQIIKNQRFSASPKKDALTLGISKSNFDWILTTDADGSLPPLWLSTYDAFIQKKEAVFIAGPIVYPSKKGLLFHYQELENFSLQTTTVSCFGLKNPMLCNGANLAYKKESFYSVKGFDGNNKIASGDDIFLLEKIKKQYPNAVHFLKSKTAIVTTTPQNTWKQIITQRVRWASKTGKQKSNSSKLIAWIVFLCNLFLIIGWVFSLFIYNWLLFQLLFVFIKMSVDYLIISKSQHFFNKKVHVLPYVLSTLLYPFITCMIAVQSIKGNYHWKDRTFKGT